MHQKEVVTLERLQGFKGGEIVLANSKAGGSSLVRGVFLEARLLGDNWLEVSYTCDDYSFGAVNEADEILWFPSSGDVTYSLLHVDASIDDNGSLHLDTETPQGSTARLVAPVPSLQAA